MKKTDALPLLSILDLAKRLIAIRSTAENNNALSEAVELIKKELQDQYTIEEFESDGFKSILAHNAKPKTKKFKIIFNAHLDVVHADTEQFSPTDKKGRLYGRGSYDMKAAAAVMTLLFKNIAKDVSYPFALQITTDEELSGLNGTDHQIQKGIRADFVITGDCGSNFNIINKSKGVMVVKLHAKGVKSHGAYPWRGENALWKIHTALAALHEAFPVPDGEEWKSTMNLAVIETNNIALNRVPDQASAILDFRFIPEDEHTIMEKIIQIVSPGVEVEIPFKEIPENTPEDNPYLQLLKKTTEATIKKNVSFLSVHGTSDVRHYNKVNCPGVEFGPIGGGQHADDEWVDIKSLGQYYEILKNFLLSVK